MNFHAVHLFGENLNSHNVFQSKQGGEFDGLNCRIQGYSFDNVPAPASLLEEIIDEFICKIVNPVYRIHLVGRKIEDVQATQADLEVLEVCPYGKEILMDVSEIVAQIDAKIASLQQARAVLMDMDETHVVAKPRRGRPKGSKNAAKAVATARKRSLTPEGRMRIAEAVKRRWADHRKEAPKKTAVKRESSSKKDVAEKK